MQISIVVDYGQGYVVSLTPRDAHLLYLELKGIFNPPQTYPVKSSNAEVKRPLTEESTGTLRDNLAHDQDCGCNTCYTEGYIRNYQKEDR